MSYHVFSQKFIDQDLYINLCKTNVHWEWEYSVPPRWLTNKISNKILKKEINTINNISVDETPKLSCSPCMVWIVSFIIGGLIAGLPQIIKCSEDWTYTGYTNTCSDFVRTFKQVSIIVGITISVCGMFVMGCLGMKRRKNANIGRQKAVEYISTLNDKYNDKDISFATYTRNITRITRSSNGATSTLNWELFDIVVSPTRNNDNIIGVIVPVNESFDAPLLSNNNEGNSEGNNKLTELGAANFCSNCGSNVRGMNFCKECGNKVSV